MKDKKVGARMMLMVQRDGTEGFRDLADTKLQKELDGSICNSDNVDILRHEQKRGSFDTCKEIVRILAANRSMICFIFTVVKESEENTIMALLKEGFEWSGYKIEVSKGALGYPDLKDEAARPVLMIKLEDRIV